MIASSALGDSEWFKLRFGGVAPTVAEALMRAGQVAHETSADTKATSGLPTDEPYGATFWQVLALEAFNRISEIQGVREVRPRGSRFKLPIVNGTTVYAVKCAAGSGPSSDRLTVRWSYFRDALLGDVERRPEETLSLWPVDEDDQELQAPTSEVDAVVLVTYVASDRGGLERIYIGDGYLDPKGTVFWLHCEELPIKANAELADSAPFAVSARFDDAPGPDLNMGLREEDADTTAGSK